VTGPSRLGMFHDVVRGGEGADALRERDVPPRATLEPVRTKASWRSAAALGLLSLPLVAVACGGEASHGGDAGPQPAAPPSPAAQVDAGTGGSPDAFLVVDVGIDVAPGADGSADAAEVIAPCPPPADEPEGSIVPPPRPCDGGPPPVH